MLNVHLSTIIFIFASLASRNAMAAQSLNNQTDVPRKPIGFRAPVQDKNFYMLTLLESTNGVARTLSNDPELASIASRKLAAESVCNVTPIHCVDAASFTSEEVALIKSRLIENLHKDPAMRSKIVAPMRQSGLFELYAANTDGDLLSKAWADAASGINRILSVYAEGQRPLYPKIDSPSFDIHSTAGNKVLSAFALRIRAISSTSIPSKKELWFQSSLELALLLLEVNDRDEAARFEPLDRGENAAAIARLPHVNWAKYRYSAIVVPGLGPEEAGVALDPGGFKRVALAAKQYREGLAPYILLSGGNVHPSQTPFCEAIEMKKALIQTLGIPADSILVEPQARHTTTNLRNASRLLYRYGFPLNLPALVTTDEAQTRSIVSPEFARRNMDELGYLPFRNLTPVSPTDTAFYVVINSLQANSLDPLDP